MTISPALLTAALRAMGNAHVYTGDPFIASGLSPLGQKEGTIDCVVEEDWNILTAPEVTGPAEHEATLRGVVVRVTVPLILGDPTLLARISPTGTKGGGFSVPQRATTTSVLVIPDEELAGGLANATGAEAGWVRTAGNGYPGGAGAAGAPANSIWLWKARVSRPSFPFSQDNGGKVITPVTFSSMWYGANPEGQKIFSQGDPTTQGITTIRI